MFLLLGDHAGNHIPRRLGDLGLAPAELARHIALDIGVSRLGHQLAALLDAPFVEQRYSRLVVDCNRAMDSSESMAAHSDGTAIPGNVAPADTERERRIAEILDPYHDRIATLLAERDRAGRATVLVALHSFTPVMNGHARPWDIGVLHDGGDSRFARALLGCLHAAGGWRIGDNEPYRMDATDYTIPRHAYPARRPYAELEVRQDHLSTEAGIARIAATLATALLAAQAIAAPKGS